MALWRWAVVCAATLGGAVALGAKHSPLLVYNASASAPVGLYRVLPRLPLGRGDLVLVPLPPAFAMLAATRRYLPPSVPLVKRIAAMGGDTVCSVGLQIFIDGIPAAMRLEADREGRALPAWRGCRRLMPGEIFLLIAGVPDSFDGRYFGPVSDAAVIGRLAPLWLR